jgi:hypothetical protein
MNLTSFNISSRSGVIVDVQWQTDYAGKHTDENEACVTVLVVLKADKE